ncbi:MAG: hypothetical protein LW626_05195 [Verrucomicrobium sp.]|jgi:hypothetical protein|nr:hypothetical protein [Verrucomicrobium sp.]
MKLLRKLHLFLGVFFTPLLVFFVATGWYQTLEPERLKTPGDAETLLQKLRVVHTDMIYPGDREFSRPSSPKLFQGIVGAMSAAVLITTALGVYLAFRTVRGTVWVVLCLVAGLVVPVVLLWMGRRG